MREIIIENERGTTMKVTLWGDLVHAIKDGMLGGRGNLLILVYCNITCETSLCTTPASRVFVDLDVQQVRDFKTKLSSDPVAVGKVELKEDNPKEGMITLFDLTDMMQHEYNKDNTCYYEAIVVGTTDGKDWYYILPVNATTELMDTYMEVFIKDDKDFLSIDHQRIEETDRGICTEEKEDEVIFDVVDEF
ncbi:hypothetical protein C5167_029332 [Papaver somniferum]|nr:hypothetical protein C5167_029332 [Papaver somniferum]